MTVTKQNIESRYLVLADGTVYSKRTNRQMIGKIDKYGYRVLCLSLEIGVKHIPVHKAVAICHLNKPEGATQVNHKDGNKLNNSAGNLEWCTASQNTQHAYNNGLSAAWNKGKSGVYTEEQVGRMKLNQPNRKGVSVFKDGYAVADYDSVRELCEQMGFDRRTAMRVLKGEQNYNSIKGFKICFQ